MCSACSNFGKHILTMRVIAKKYARDKNVDEFLNKND